MRSSLLPTSSTSGEGANKPMILTDQTFNEGISKGYTFVDYWAEWCGPCRMVAPVIDKIAEKWAGKVKFAKLNIDENQLTMNKFGIMSIPTFILFKDGEAVAQISGAGPEGYFDQFLKGNVKDSEAKAV